MLVEGALSPINCALNPNLAEYGAHRAYMPLQAAFRVPLKVNAEGFPAEVCDVHAQGFQAVHGSAGLHTLRAPCFCSALLAEEAGP